MQVPFFRPSISDAEIEEVVNCLRSGWLTTGPVTRRFEAAFAEAVGAKFAVALNSCTAALHLAVEALGLKEGQGVLVPTMTFAATAEVVRYQGAVPILVDCDPVTGNLDLADAERKLQGVRDGHLGNAIDRDLEIVGIMPVHVGGDMMDIEAVNEFAKLHGLWVVEDAAHAFPAAWRASSTTAWQRCGERTASVTCFSFYANKTITTGEGGMATTDDESLAARMRSMSLHGLSHDAWKRYSGGSWDYRIIAPGYKYNLTDIASAIGIHQLARAEEMRLARQKLAEAYHSAFAPCDEIELPANRNNRLHSWHLYPIRLNLERLQVGRDEFLQALKNEGVGCSVHWRPLHLHPYYQEQFGWNGSDFPVATQEWQRLTSLPIFPAMSEAEQTHIVQTVKLLCTKWRTSSKAKIESSLQEAV